MEAKDELVSKDLNPNDKDMSINNISIIKPNIENSNKVNNESDFQDMQRY